ncbi:MAG: hypothetical protein LUQ11_13520 [Methylococcaceae bacterium]|nr:hypothetical protein [Methylococcaceae bacterium]
MCIKNTLNTLIPVLVVILGLFFQACAGWKSLPTLGAEQADCERLFQEMDQRVAESSVADAGTARIAGFPELRVDRFLASFAKENLTGEAYAAWLERLRQLGETTRMIEWRNLPPEAKSHLKTHSGANVEEAVNVCGHILAEQDLIYPSRRAQLLAEVEPPDAYSNWQRVFGLYFFSRWAIVEGVWRVQREMREPFVKPDQNQSAAGQLIRYTPPTRNVLGTDEVAKILEYSADNPLGIPEPSEDQLGRLFSTFAPVWAVDTADGGDRIGMVRIGGDGEATIDTNEASVYRLVSHTRFGGQVLLQLNYMVWFPARSPEAWLDIYAGRFDGLIWRVTLGMDGKPLAYDSIHSCGCYYQIFPGEGFRVAQPMDGSEPILSPMPILGPKPGESLVVTLSSRTHFIQGISEEAPESGSLTYGWRDYDDLRSLSLPDGRHRSLFDTDGLVPGSERPERFLLWPMGVPSAGAMRQWGTHAIAFLGKRHFDDPRLLEKLLRPLWE